MKLTVIIVCDFVMAVAFLNCTAFILVAVCLGGDAVNGGASGDHYFLAAHGHQVEVSHGVWIYSRIHAFSAMISAPLFIAAAFIHNYLMKSKHDNAT